MDLIMPFPFSGRRAIPYPRNESLLLDCELSLIHITEPPPTPRTAPWDLPVGATVRLYTCQVVIQAAMRNVHLITLAMMHLASGDDTGAPIQGGQPCS